MKTFKDLVFKPTHFGVQAREDFENGYGVSVYGGPEGKYELAVFKGDHLCYTTPVTSDVEGHLEPDDVTKLMKQVQGLPKAE